MDKDTFELLVRYNKGANQQMNDIIKILSEEEWNKQFSGYFKSIHELCSHIFIRDYTVLYKFKAVNKFESLSDAYFSKEYNSSEILFKNIDEYLIKRLELDNIFINFIHEITVDDLNKEIIWKNTKDIEIKIKSKIMLLHLFNHETHHRGMISLYLELMGKENDYSRVYTYA
ncbi:MAG: DinB family protein [Spirochaetaceae bacterium]|nr:DinB family protein [Spirochaetaceae bacterium]